MMVFGVGRKINQKVDNMLISLNNNLICTPFREGYNKSTKFNKVELLSSSTVLEPLTVLLDCRVMDSGTTTCSFLKGDVVYVKGDRCKSPWSTKQTCEALLDKDNKPIPFIIVPYNEVVIATGK
jgi:hypothetical protein